MATALRLAVQPPYAPAPPVPPGAWTRVYGYGPETLPGPPPTTVFRDHTRLRTTGAGQVLAVCNGRLSTRPPGNDGLEPAGELEPLVSDAPLPATITLYLHLSPPVLADRDFRDRAGQVGGLLAFAYLNLETASLEAALAELLDAATFPPGSVPRAQAVRLLVHGQVDVSVPVGQVIGAASGEGAPAGAREVGLAWVTPQGLLEVSHGYDLMRGFVTDGQPQVDAFLALADRRWPVVDPALSTDAVIALTRTSLYPAIVLESVRTGRNLSAAQWRQVGDHQKALHREALFRRVGFPLAGSTAPPFEFNDRDWQNLFQLEAITEFFANYDDPWLTDAQGNRRPPRRPGEAGYVTVNFLGPAGVAATVAGDVVTLDGAPDLTYAAQSVLHLEGDTARPLRTYRIREAGRAPNTVTVELDAGETGPDLGGRPSRWHIQLKPLLVCIDAFGGRLQGRQARVTGDNVVTLDATTRVEDLGKVNARFDTIYLPGDSARPSRTYWILGVNSAQRTLTLDGNPVLEGGTSPWHLPAGVSGELPALNYRLGPPPPPPNAALAHDHYDGVMFVVHRGAVSGRVRFSSYTSRNYERPSQSLSSIRGNRRYDIRSFASRDSDFRNFCFRVEDPGFVDDLVAEARYYFDARVDADTLPPGQPRDARLRAAAFRQSGKTLIRIHRGNLQERPGTGSEGCVVSPAFYELRDMLIARYQEDFATLNGAGRTDPLVEQLRGLHLTANARVNPNPVGRFWRRYLAQSQTWWDNRLFAALWVIRPEERPLG